MSLTRKLVAADAIRRMLAAARAGRRLTVWAMDEDQGRWLRRFADEWLGEAARRIVVRVECHGPTFRWQGGKP